MSSINQRVEQKASYQNVKNMELQLETYAKLTSVHLLHDLID